VFLATSEAVMSDGPIMGVHSLKRDAQAALQAAAPGLIELSGALHADPETARAGHRSAQRVATVLAGHGFTVIKPYLGSKLRSWPARVLVRSGSASAPNTTRSPVLVMPAGTI
jgi:hypothetical protein